MHVSIILFLTSTIQVAAIHQDNGVADPPAVLRIVDNMQRITTGEYTCQSHASKTTHREGVVSQSDDSIQCVFDRTSGKQCFLRTRVNAEGASKTTMDGDEVGRFVTFPDHVITVTGKLGQNGWSVGIHPFRDPKNAGSRFSPVFDIRTIPFVKYQHLANDFDEMRVCFNGAAVRELPESGLTEIQLNWDAQVHRWLTDPKQGGQVTRYTVTNDQETLERSIRAIEARYPDRPPLFRPNPVVVESTTSWEQQGEVWVPSKYHHESRETGSVITLDLDFHWKSVNQPIPSSRFHWKSWDLPNETRVFDMRLGEGQGLLVDVIGNPREIPLTTEAQKDLFTSTRVKVLYANLVVVAAILGFWLAQQRRQRHGPAR